MAILLPYTFICDDAALVTSMRLFFSIKWSRVRSISHLALGKILKLKRIHKTQRRKKTMSFIGKTSHGRLEKRKWEKVSAHPGTL